MKTDLTVNDVELVVDPEFHSVLPIATTGEDKDLQALIEADGEIEESIKFWMHNGKAIIVDGMRRYRLWSLLSDAGAKVPPPRVKEKRFASRADAMEWMTNHQLTRRNVSPRTAASLRGRFCRNLIKQAVAAAKSGKTKPKTNSRQNAENSKRRGRKATPENAAVTEASEKTGVSERTLRRDIEYVEAIDAIGRVNSKAKADIESGAWKVTKDDVIQIGRLSQKEIGAALTNIRFGKKWDAGMDGAPEPAPRDLIADAAKVIGQLAALTKQAGDEPGWKPIAASLRKIADSLDPPEEASKFRKPTLADVEAYCKERKNKIDPQAFIDFYESKGWLIGKAKMKDWRAAIRTWEKDRSTSNGKPAKGINDDAFAAVFGG